MTSGSYNRQKGCQLERDLVIELKDIFEDCMTARAGDRSLDNLGIDILNCQPLGLQCHCSKNFSVAKLDRLLASSEELSGKGYSIPLYLLKRPHKPKTVTMRWEDFVKMFRESLR